MYKNSLRECDYYGIKIRNITNLIQYFNPSHRQS